MQCVRNDTPPLSEAEVDEWVQCELCQLRFSFLCLDAPNGDWLCHKVWPHCARETRLSERDCTKFIKRVLDSLILRFHTHRERERELSDVDCSIFYC